MPHHFSVIKAQLAADLVAVLALYPSTPPAAPVVKFGRPIKPIRTYPHAVVRTAVDRKNVGRNVEETYEIEIELRLPIPDAQSVEIEEYLFGAADRVIQRFAPFDPDDVPTPARPYAGVAYGPYGTDVMPGEDADADPFRSVKIGLKCTCSVFQ